MDKRVKRGTFNGQRKHLSPKRRLQYNINMWETIHDKITN